MGKQSANRDELIKELDIAKKKIAELEKSYKMFYGIYEDIGDGVISLDKKGNVLEVNSALCNITGINRERIIGKNAVVLAKEFLSIKDIPNILKNIAKILKGQKTERYELKYKDLIFEGILLIIILIINY